MLRTLCTCLCGAEFAVDHNEGQDEFTDAPPAWAQRVEEVSTAASEHPCLSDRSASSSYLPGETPAGIRPLHCLWQSSYSAGHSAFGTWTPSDDVESFGTPGTGPRGASAATVTPDASGAAQSNTSHPARELSHLVPAQPHTPSLAPAPRPSSMPDISGPDASRGQGLPQDRGHALGGTLLPPHTNAAGAIPPAPASLPSPAWGSNATSQQGSATGPGLPASRHGSTLLGQLARRPPRAPASVSSHASSQASHTSISGMAAGSSSGGVADALLGALRTLKRHGTNIGSRDPNDRVSLQRITAGGAAPPPTVTLQRTPSEIRQHLQSQAPKRSILKGAGGRAAPRHSRLARSSSRGGGGVSFMTDTPDAGGDRDDDRDRDIRGGKRSDHGGGADAAPASPATPMPSRPRFDLGSAASQQTHTEVSTAAATTTTAPSPSAGDPTGPQGDAVPPQDEGQANTQSRPMSATPHVDEGPATLSPSTPFSGRLPLGSSPSRAPTGLLHTPTSPLDASSDVRSREPGDRDGASGGIERTSCEAAASQAEPTGDLWRARVTGLEPMPLRDSRFSQSRMGLGAAVGAGVGQGSVSASPAGEADELLLLQHSLGLEDSDTEARTSGGSGRSVSADGRPLHPTSGQRQQDRDAQQRRQTLPSPPAAKRHRPAPIVLPGNSQRSLGPGSRQLSAGGRDPALGQGPSPGLSSDPLVSTASFTGASQQHHQTPSTARSLSRVARQSLSGLPRIAAGVAAGLAAALGAGSLPGSPRDAPCSGSASGGTPRSSRGASGPGVVSGVGSPVPAAALSPLGPVTQMQRDQQHLPPATPSHPSHNRPRSGSSPGQGQPAPGPFLSAHRLSCGRNSATVAPEPQPGGLNSTSPGARAAGAHVPASPGGQTASAAPRLDACNSAGRLASPLGLAGPGHTQHQGQGQRLPLTRAFSLQDRDRAGLAAASETSGRPVLSSIAQHMHTHAHGFSHTHAVVPPVASEPGPASARRLPPRAHTSALTLSPLPLGQAPGLPAGPRRASIAGGVTVAPTSPAALPPGGAGSASAGGALQPLDPTLYPGGGGATASPRHTFSGRTHAPAMAAGGAGAAAISRSTRRQTTGDLGGVGRCLEEAMTLGARRWQQQVHPALARLGAAVGGLPGVGGGSGAGSGPAGYSLEACSDGGGGTAMHVRGQAQAQVKAGPRPAERTVRSSGQGPEGGGGGGASGGEAGGADVVGQRRAAGLTAAGGVGSARELVRSNEVQPYIVAGQGTAAHVSGIPQLEPGATAMEECAGPDAAGSKRKSSSTARGAGASPARDRAPGQAPRPHAHARAHTHTHRHRQYLPATGQGPGAGGGEAAARASSQPRGRISVPGHQAVQEQPPGAAGGRSGQGRQPQASSQWRREGAAGAAAGLLEELPGVVPGAGWDAGQR